jgi:hypothetical protein
MKLTGYDGSYRENEVFEFGYNQKAASAIRILQWSHDQGIPTCYITNSISTACPGFSHSSSTLSAVETALAEGHLIIMPQRDITIGQWSGTGYIDMNPSTGAAGYIIIGGISSQVSVCGSSTIDAWPIDLGCEPYDYLSGEITPEGFSDGEVLCAGNYYIGYDVELDYDCKQADGSIENEVFSARYSLPPTTLGIVETYGPGTYTISIPEGDVDPVSFTLVYVEFTEDEVATRWQTGGTFDAKNLSKHRQHHRFIAAQLDD